MTLTSRATPPRARASVAAARGWALRSTRVTFLQYEPSDNRTKLNPAKVRWKTVKSVENRTGRQRVVVMSAGNWAGNPRVRWISLPHFIPHGVVEREHRGRARHFCVTARNLSGKTRKSQAAREKRTGRL